MTLALGNATEGQKPNSRCSATGLAAVRNNNISTFFFFFATQHGMQDLSSLTRD